MSRLRRGVSYLGLGMALAYGVAGLVGGVLTAPASGKETRRRIRRRAGEERDAFLRKGRRAVCDAAEYASTRLEEGRLRLRKFTSV